MQVILKFYIYRNSKQKTEWVKLNEAGAAGVFPSYMLPEPYKQEELQLDHGDIIYLFTDGIEEARNGKMIRDEKGEEKPEEFGDERIRAVLDKSGDKTPKEMIERLIAEESRFRGDFEQYDDLTILGIKVK
jgi:serine phosphatase RsbU (regulator of sigma subunit)